MKDGKIWVILVLVVFVLTQKGSLFSTANVGNMNDDLIDIYTYATGTQETFYPDSISVNDKVKGLDINQIELTADLSMSVMGATASNGDTGSSASISIVGSTKTVSIDSFSILCARCGSEQRDSKAYKMKIQFYPDNDLLKVYHNDVLFSDYTFTDNSFDITSSAESHVGGNRGSADATVVLKNIVRKSKQCPTIPSPTSWSSCVSNSQARTNYRCTNYQIESFTETQACVSSIELSNNVTNLCPQGTSFYSQCNTCGCEPSTGNIICTQSYCTPCNLGEWIGGNCITDFVYVTPNVTANVTTPVTTPPTSTPEKKSSNTLLLIGVAFVGFIIMLKILK